MTKLERLAKRQADEHAALVKQKQRTAAADKQVREAARKDTHKRRYHVGALADETGLFDWSNAELFALFVVLGALKGCPNPAAVLEGLLRDEVGTQIGGYSRVS